MGANYDNSYFFNVRTEMLQFVPESYSKVLEIGCGSGLFMKLLKDDIEYWGVDPYNAPEASRKIMKRFIRGTLEESSIEIPDRYFDLIIINDVMEHSTDHLLFLEILKSKLKLNGFIIGSVPNVRYIKNLYNLIIKRDWFYDPKGGILDYTHYRLFTKKSLKSIFDLHQFKTEHLTGINPIWYSDYRYRQIIKICLIFPFCLILGSDIQFLQIAFKIKNEV